MTEDQIAEEAVAWLMHLRESKEGYDREFWRWLLTSPTHLRIFMEIRQLLERVLHKQLTHS